MQILLTAINAKYIHSNLAVYSLKASAGEYSSHVELAEFTINHRTEEILSEIYRKKPEVLLFSCYIWNIEQVKELVRECAKVLPETPIWLGGPEVSFCPLEILKEYTEVAGILTGEGEESFRLLAECYVRKTKRWKEIPGAVFRKSAMELKKSEKYRNEETQEDKDDIFSNNQGKPLDMDTLPFPYTGFMDFAHRIIYYESSRGCPFACSYCLSSIDKQVRFRDLKLVFRELQYFLDAKVLQVKFVDRTFNCSHSHAFAIWRYLLEHDNGVTNFHFEIAADLLNEEEMELMAQMRPGLIQLEVGVQSVNIKTIDAIHRRMDLEKVRANVARIHRMGNIHQHLDLIAGLPYEDYVSFAHSFDEVFAMKPEQLQLGFLKVLQGSPMYREAEQYGIVCKDKPPYEVLYTNWLSFSDILQLKAIEEMVEIYYNSHQFRHTLEKLLKTAPSPFYFFQQLADFYERKGLNGRNHSRLQRYEILLEFIREICSKEEDRYRELLTIDLYGREKVKSRPAFASDQSPYQTKIRQILSQTGKQKHVEALLTWGEMPVYLIFDYEARDPLTHDASITQWKEA
ncbi:MAG: B12-binding domain-containing radical SAM protein [Lachnospiraceae bacterium]|jgi:radical SAM superfamily enzyme YgiQ (UPF0313 family)|nr:B12-binding domain-containing radical SAM protein [Lachnospiraceae bacterium]